ncbi:4Fe-4S binding protein [Candidatus Ozemobacteraceae bacterium]|nr:4Fe-4S binding protein [Candidatus Ozemobacteraceae bacterium]
MQVCKGATGTCPHALSGTEPLIAGIDRVLVSFGIGSPDDAGAAAHLRFSIGIAACPNACSRPQIMDVGFIRAEYPSIPAGHCTGCGACLSACREGCLSLRDGRIDCAFATCVGCGACRTACPVEAIAPEREGFRVLVGGRLGRHPRLATELPGLFTAEQACDRLTICLRALSSAPRPGMRLAALMDDERSGLSRSLGLEW